MVKKIKKNKFQFKKSNRQLFGFVLLLFVFALLLYTAILLYNEGTVFKPKPESTAISKQNPDLTTVSITYKQNSTNRTR